MATVRKDTQQSTISDTHTSVVTGSGSDGIFICSSTHPFVAANLVKQNFGKVGYAVKLTSKDGSNPIVGTITVNGVLGDADALDDATGWLAGEGFVMEIEAMTMTAGYAIILLKTTVNQTS